MDFHVYTISIFVRDKVLAWLVNATMDRTLILYDEHYCLKSFGETVHRDFMWILTLLGFVAIRYYQVTIAQTKNYSI